MTSPAVGDKAQVRYVDSDSTYTLAVDVMAVPSPHEFIGRVIAIFLTGARAEVTEGSIVTELGGREKRFRIEDIVLLQPGRQRVT